MFCLNFAGKFFSIQAILRWNYLIHFIMWFSSYKKFIFFLSKHKLFIFANINIYKNFCKGKPRHFSINYSPVVTIMYWSLKNKNNLFFEFFAFLVFRNEVILGWRILNICEATFSRSMFQVSPSCKFLDVLLPKFYIHLKYLLNYCVHNNFDTFLIKNTC